MDKLKKEIILLTDKLETGQFGANGDEAFVLTQLKQIFREIDGSGNIQVIDGFFGQLRQFWLESIPWCSELSKNIEKLIIIHEESKDEGRD